MTETTNPPPRDETVDDMAERLAKQLHTNREMRKALALDRDEINVRIKQLDVEIDKAERMTKALIPRTRSKSTADATARTRAADAFGGEP